MGQLSSYISHPYFYLCYIKAGSGPPATEHVCRMHTHAPTLLSRPLIPPPLVSGENPVEGSFKHCLKLGLEYREFSLSRDSHCLDYKYC